MGGKHLGQGNLGGRISRARSVAFLKMKIERGWANHLIAKEFNVSRDTVERGIRKAINDGFLQQFEDQLIKDLVPKAMKALDIALEAGDSGVAVEIFKGIGLLKKQAERPRIDHDGGDGDSLEIYISKKRSADPDRAITSGSAKYFPQLSPEKSDPAVSFSSQELAERVREIDDIDRLSGTPTASDGTVVAQEGELVGEEDAE